uniref:ATP synthase F0 subunit 8 n=1 Tax=Aegista diversifamilia TaxID=1545397 RepID=A0A0U2DWE1_AEGDI|nr:ATP synthase F0 subunit 8 [Aegista diversifamilia]AKP55345.1 ATP synthase F0 subunit 8 [Aegista diversifamilia]
MLISSIISTLPQLSPHNLALLVCVYMFYLILLMLISKNTSWTFKSHEPMSKKNKPLQYM